MVSEDKKIRKKEVWLHSKMHNSSSWLTKLLKAAQVTTRFLLMFNLSKAAFHNMVMSRFSWTIGPKDYTDWEWLTFCSTHQANLWWEKDGVRAWGEDYFALSKVGVGSLFHILDGDGNGDYLWAEREHISMQAYCFCWDIWTFCPFDFVASTRKSHSLEY